MPTYGSVYIFNLYSAPVASITLNGMPKSAGTIDAPAKGSASPFYTPPQTVVLRSNLQQSQLDPSQAPVFINGTNTLTINYSGDSWTGTIDIPKPPGLPYAKDLWLYIAYQQMFLFRAEDGSIIPQPSGGMLQGAKGGGGTSLSAPLTKQSGSGRGASKGAGSKGGASKGGASKGGGKGGASKGGAKKGSSKR